MEKSRINHILHSHVNGSFVLTIQYVLRNKHLGHTYVCIWSDSFCGLWYKTENWLLSWNVWAFICTLITKLKIAHWILYFQEQLNISIWTKTNQGRLVLAKLKFWVQIKWVNTSILYPKVIWYHYLFFSSNAC